MIIECFCFMFLESCKLRLLKTVYFAAFILKVFQRFELPFTCTFNSSHDLMTPAFFQNMEFPFFAHKIESHAHRNFS